MGLLTDVWKFQCPSTISLDFTVANVETTKTDRIDLLLNRFAPINSFFYFEWIVSPNRQGFPEYNGKKTSKSDQK